MSVSSVNFGCGSAPHFSAATLSSPVSPRFGGRNVNDVPKDDILPPNPWPREGDTVDLAGSTVSTESEPATGQGKLRKKLAGLYAQVWVALANITNHPAFPKF